MVSSAPTRTSRQEDLTTIAVATWLIAGLLVDVYKHSTDGGNLESFWTPWHAMFYSGFLATAAWLFVLTVRRRRPEGTLLDWAPLGHRTALIGVAIFGVGGLGDAIWHTIFGVETSLDALLSPTDILLFVGLLLIVTAPLSAAWLDTDPAKDMSFVGFLPGIVSLSFAVLLVAGFFQYAWVLGADWLPRELYDPITGRGEGDVARGIAGILVTTLILFAPIHMVLRRWRLPFGAVTTVFVVVNLITAIAFDMDRVGIVPALIAGVITDILIATDVDLRVMAFAAPVVLWSTYFLLVGRIDQGIQWPPEVWSGGIFFAGLISLAIHMGLDLAANRTVAEDLVSA